MPKFSSLKPLETKFSLIFLVMLLMLGYLAFMQKPRLVSSGVVTIPASATEVIIDLREKREFTPSLSDLKGLTHVEIVGTGGDDTARLERLLSEVGKLTNLKIFGLTGFSFTQLPDSVWHLPNLAGIEDLRLDANKLTALPGQISALSRLKKLSMTSNNIATVAPLWNPLPLETLLLSQNNLTEVPLEFLRSTRMITLDLSKNQIARIPGGIGELSMLEALNLSDNPDIQDLPDDISRLNLKVLNLHVGSPEEKSRFDEATYIRFQKLLPHTDLKL